MVASPDPGALIGSSQQCVDLFAVEIVNRLPCIAFARDGQDLLGECGMAGLVQRNETKQGPYGGQTRVAGSCVVAALAFELMEKRGKKRRIEVNDGEVLRRLAEDLLGVADEQAEGIPITGDSVRAGLALLDEMGVEKPAEECGEIGGSGHGLAPCCTRSR